MKRPLSFVVFLFSLIFLIGSPGQLKAFDVLGIELGMPLEVAVEKLKGEIGEEIDRYSTNPERQRKDLFEIYDQFGLDEREKNYCPDYASIDNVFEYGLLIVPRDDNRQEFLLYYDSKKQEKPIIAFIRSMKYRDYNFEEDDVVRAIKEKYSNPHAEYVKGHEYLWISKKNAKSTRNKCTVNPYSFLKTRKSSGRGSSKGSNCLKYVEQPTRAQIIREQKRISNYPWLDEKMTRVNRFTVRLTNYGTPWEDCGASLKVLIEENNQLATFILIDTGAAKEIFNARKLSSENERRLPEPDSSVKF